MAALGAKRDTETFGAARPMIVIEPREAHTATLFFFHGLGDSCDGWGDACGQWAKEIPGLKCIVPTAPMNPVTLNGGSKCASWCDLEVSSMSNPMEMLGLLTKRPPLLDNSWVETLSLVNRELALMEAGSSSVGLNRMFFAGFSLGAHLAAWVALQLPAPCAGVMMLSGVAMGTSVLAMKQKELPILHCHGSQDMVIPYMAAQMQAETLRGMGHAAGKYTLKTYQSMGHEACPEEIRECAAFLRANGAGREGAPAAGAPAGKLTILGSAQPLPKGTRVRIENLKSAASACHNGKVGVVLGYEGSKGRYTVAVVADDSGGRVEDERTENKTSMLLQAGNVRLMSVKVVRSQDAGAPAESEALPTAADDESGQCTLAPGAIVRVARLQSDKACPWNGCFAVVKSKNAETGRYMLDMGGRCSLQIKLGSLDM